MFFELFTLHGWFGKNKEQLFSFHILQYSVTIFDGNDHRRQHGVSPGPEAYIRFVDNYICMKYPSIKENSSLKLSRIFFWFMAASLCKLQSQKRMFREGLLQEGHLVQKHFQYLPYIISYSGKFDSQVDVENSQRLSRSLLETLYSSNSIVITYWTMFRSESMSQCPAFWKFMKPTTQRACKGGQELYSLTDYHF